MRVTIVMPSYNQGPYVEESVRSVLSQDHADIELIVVDGGSTDETVEILRRYGDRFRHWVSEPDQGQVDAINKGLRRAEGDVFGFLNSDDLLLPGAVTAVTQFFDTHPESSWVCGDTIMFGDGHATEFVQAKVPRTVGQLLGWRYRAPQPGMFWKIELVRAGFDTRWNYVFDHDLYLRLLLQGFQCDHLGIPLAAYRLHATSKTVAEAALMDAEFDEVARTHEPSLSWRDRRRSRAVRTIRRASRAADVDDRGEALRGVIAAGRAYPPSLVSRPVLGTIRRTARRRDRRVGRR